MKYVWIRFKMCYFKIWRLGIFTVKELETWHVLGELSGMSLKQVKRVSQCPKREGLLRET